MFLKKQELANKVMELAPKDAVDLHNFEKLMKKPPRALKTDLEKINSALAISEVCCCTKNRIKFQTHK